MKYQAHYMSRNLLAEFIGVHAHSILKSLRLTENIQVWNTEFLSSALRDDNSIKVRSPANPFQKELHS